MWTRQDFNYELPSDLIAQVPLAERRGSRLLVVGAEAKRVDETAEKKAEEKITLQDKQFTDLLDYLNKGDRLVFNNTRVIPARLHGQKSTGGKIELLLERCVTDTQALVHLRASKTPKAGGQLHFDDNCVVTVLDKHDALYKVEFDRDIVPYLEAFGHMPLPPYIEREDNALDQTRYQTVFAKELGAVAAPTASLHFDEEMLSELTQRGIDSSEITLHVGAGTFQPVRSNDLSKHIMHSEWLDVPQAVCDEIIKTKQQGGRIIAVGTTVVRSLETAAMNKPEDAFKNVSMRGQLKAFKGDSQLFIMPGFEFKVIDAMLTNFHLPESTLLMLVSAFSGYEEIKQAYQHAIKNQYRFFSYGDAMLLLNKNKQAI